MTRDELIAVVPVHEFCGRPFYVRIEDVPAPWGQQFKRAIVGSAQPVIDGERACAHAHDWKSWVFGTWYGGHNRPTGFEGRQIGSWLGCWCIEATGSLGSMWA